MIYEVYVDDKLLYYPNDETYAIINSKLDLALNEAGAFEFDVPTYNLRYDDFKLRKSMVQVLQNGEEIFYGEVREVRTNADFTKHVYAVGELAFLFDSIQPQARYLTSPLNAMTQIIAKHNSQVEDRKKFTLSHVDVTDSDDQIYFYTNGEDSLSIIRQKICDSLDGYIKISKVNNIRYISIVPLSSFGTCKQEIQFGENLLDYSCNMSASDIATCVIPRGAKLDDDKRTADAVEGLDEYLTIKGTSADYYHKAKDNDFVQLDEAIAKFGYVRVLKTWDNVTIAENLKEKATEWLKSAQYEAMTLELKALDMAQFDVNIDTFRLGEQIRVWALPYGMDTTFPVRKKVIYLQELEKNEVVLGNTIRQSFTNQASNAVEQLKHELPEETTLLDQAQANAIAILTDPSKGYVNYVFDEDGNRTEIWISDNMDSSKATKKWVWNSSGLGYMYKENGVWKSNLAITMDGRINADFITAGVLSGIEINNGNGTFKVDSKGKLTATGANINGNFESQSGKSYVKISEGKLETNGNIKGSTVSGSFVTGTSVSGNEVYGKKYYVSSDGNNYEGQTTGAFSLQVYQDGTKYVGLNFKNGLLVGVSGF